MHYEQPIRLVTFSYKDDSSIFTFCSVIYDFFLFPLLCLFLFVSSLHLLSFLFPFTPSHNCFSNPKL